MQHTDTSIMIVDDAKFSSAVVDKALQSAGYSDIRHANSARDAIAQLDQRRTSILIADWLMPEMDGLELTQHVRQLDETDNRYTYVILLTAKEGVDALREAFDQGVDDFVNKSAMSGQLLPRVMAAERISSIQNRILNDNERLLQANSKLRKQTTLDPLTGFGNQQYALRRLDDAIRQANSRGGAACLLTLRIEEYETMSQQYGAAIMQQLVLAFSRRLRQLVRPLDILCRIGIDTFVVITHQPSLDMCVPASFRRLHEALNLRAYKTAAGFTQMKVNICLSAVGEHQPVAAADMIRKTLSGLPHSAEQQRISTVALS